MEKATDNQVNARYNDESLFLEEIIEFHPEVYNALPARDQEVLQAYYLVGQPVPENIFEYRKALLHEQPSIEAQAKAVFDRILSMLKINKFEYSTRPADTPKN